MAHGIVGAALSEDPDLISDYLSGDVYHALAKMCGLTDEQDPKRWKNDQPEVR